MLHLLKGHAKVEFHIVVNHRSTLVALAENLVIQSSAGAGRPLIPWKNNKASDPCLKTWDTHVNYCHSHTRDQ